MGTPNRADNPYYPGEHVETVVAPRASRAASLMSRFRNALSLGADNIAQTTDNNLGIKTDPYMVEQFQSAKNAGLIGPNASGWPLWANAVGNPGPDEAVSVPHQYIRDTTYRSAPMGARSDRTRLPVTPGTVSIDEGSQIDAVYVGSPS